MKRFAVLLGASAAVVLPFAQGSSRTLPLRGPEAATRPLTALVPAADGSAAVRLAQLDPATLAPVRRSTPLGPVDAWVRSPDRRLLALGVQTGAPQDESTLRFANVATLRLARRGVKLDGQLRAALWPSMGRLLALVDDGSGASLALDTVDTVAKRVVARQTLSGIAAAIARSAGGLAVLVEKPNAIAVPSLAVVGSDGSVRSVRLDRIRAGWSWPTAAANDPIGATRTPGFAVDPAGTAYVLDPDGLVAAVDLASLAVSYHTLGSPSLSARLAGWLTPAAHAKGVNGPDRVAAWLGDGLIALTGTDNAAARAQDGTATFTESPAGLAVADTRDWTLRTLDRDASAATVADGALLATGGGWSYDGTKTVSSGEGLAAYGPDGALRWRLFPGSRPWVVGVVGGLALVQEDSGPLAVVDVASGRLVESGHARATLLVGEGS